MTKPVTLVIGSHGLLGSRLMAALRSRGLDPLEQKVRWGSPDDVGIDLAEGADRLLAAADGGPWRIAWCAGVGVTNSAPADLHREVELLRDFLGGLADRAAALAASGSVFLASSAGGVYAGSSSPPFSERTVPVPISAYGEAKLAAERVVQDFCDLTGCRSLVGRIANLYGPGQDVRKPQGLIAHLCRGQVTGQPVSVYVSLDTLRDYIYVDDCVELILDGLDRLEADPDSTNVTKILASQRSVSVGSLLKETGRVFHHPARVLVAASPFSLAQARDIRLRSVVWPDLDRRTLMPLPAGIAATRQDIQEHAWARRSA